MLRDEVLLLLMEADGYVSGTEISAALGVTRMAVSNAVRALREAGYEIDAVTNRGYCLRRTAGNLNAGEVLAHLPSSRRDTVRCFDRIDSTNTYLKREAMSGAAHGLVAVANEQTAGRGRSGRGFVSAQGRGVYLSILLRPNCSVQRCATLTAHAAVAVCRALERMGDFSARIKWTNDVLLGEKKICGILTELTLEGESAALDSVIIGIGVNILYRAEDFPPELREKAGSVYSETGIELDRAEFAANLILELDAMVAAWAADEVAYLEDYRARCVTTNRDVLVIRGDETHEAHALSITKDFGLRVRYSDGTEETLHTGEVSVRGTAGYL